MDNIQDDQIVSYRTAELARELKFKWNCSSAWFNCTNNKDVPVLFNSGQPNWYDSVMCSMYYTSAPTQNKLNKWLREVHNIHIDITSYFNDITDPKITHQATADMMRHGYWGYIEYESDKHDYDVYEECLEEILYECLKALKEKINDKA